MRINFIKPIIGILLIALAVGFLVYWESEGREVIVTKEVLMASVDIPMGSEITASQVKTSRVLIENKIEGAYIPADIEKIVGKKASHNIKANSQFSSESIQKEEIFKKEISAFRIENEWIFSCSSSLRAGDVIECYTSDGEMFIGEYSVAFVKDADDMEIVSQNGKKYSDIWDRKDGTARIDHIEIAATLDEFKDILNAVELFGESLLIVQKR